MMRAVWVLLLAGACGSNDPIKTDAKTSDGKTSDGIGSDGGTDAALCASKTNMVSWWRAEGDAADSIGSNTGTVTGGGYAPGRVGQTFILSGTAQYVSVADDNSLDFTTEMTVEAWINQAVITDARIVDKITPGGTNGWWFDVINSKLRFGVGSGSVQSPANLAPTTWLHVAGTYDSTAIKIYVNGAQVATLAQTSAIPVNTLALTIGGSSAHGNLFNGSIDEVAVYNKALTDAEVQAVFAAGSRGHCQ